MATASKLTEELQSSHDALSFNITSGNQVSARATSVLKHLRSRRTEGEESADQKPVLVRLYALASTANKLITITEIVKRQLVTEKVKVYQYNVLGSEMITIKAKSEVKGSGGRNLSATGGDASAMEVEEQEEEAFETMGGKEKVRNVPTLTVYLCLNSLPQLRKQYDEQTNMDTS